MIRKLLKLGAAAALVALSAWGALALSVDPNRNVIARQYSTLQPTYYRITVNFNDANIGSTAGVAFGKLLQNTFIDNVACHVTTAFNAGTTNKFFVGTDAAVTNIIASGVSNKSVTEGTAGYYSITQSGSLGVGPTSDADHNIVAKYTQTGTAATAGTVTCVFEIIPNNDM